MTLLSPFDNLISSNQRTNRIFGFNYVREQFFPQEKRQFGTYVLPILMGDRFIGRLDPKMDRARNRLLINAVFAEVDAPAGAEVASWVSNTIENLAQFLGADGVEYSDRVPDIWRNALK
jgi:uncharacterized protein YcaQ